MINRWLKEGYFEYSSRIILRSLLFLYRHTFSALVGRQCRFFPTCSVYADEAIQRFGARKGLALATRRLCRCHPWGGSGFDPVPESMKIIE